MTTNQEYKDIYKTLSNQKKEILSSPELSKIIDSIAYLRHLSVIQRNAIALIIKDLLYGITDVNNISAKIIETTLVDQHISDEIGAEIKLQILDNLATLENQIKLNVAAENLANGIEPDEEENEFEKISIPKDSKKSYTSQWSDLLATYQPETLNQSQKEDLLHEVSIMLSNESVDYKKIEGILPEYKKAVPRDIKDLICTSSVWMVRGNEIALKYSLNNLQTNTLINTIFFILVGVEPGTKLGDILRSKLDVSSLLGEQIYDDVEARIFKYNIESLQKKNNGFEKKNILQNTLDIPPANLPGEIIENNEQQNIESVPPAHTQPTPSREISFAGAPQTPFNSTQDVQTNPSTLYAPENKAAFSFKTPSSEPLIEPATQAQTPSPQTPTQKPSFISNKLSQSTKPQIPPFEVQKTYSVDPYREPIE
jgi:hypothetical protein